MPALVGRRRLEGRDLRALRVDLADDVLDRPALARRVQALEDQEQAPGAGGSPLGVEHLLQVSEPRRE